MRQRINFSITQKHIDEANSRLVSKYHGARSLNCPAAIALSEKLGKLVSVGCGSATVYADDSRYSPIAHIFFAHSRLWQWIVDFDLGRPVQPARFSVTLRS